MSACCHDHACDAKPVVDTRYRKVLWVALLVNAAMFFVEIGGGIGAGSASLLADAIDFLGDAVNYGVSLFVLSLAAVWRSRTALAKGITMGAYGVAVLAVTAFNISQGTKPAAMTMGVIGVLALVANLAVAGLLYRYRDGDANMRSVWLCTRNDAIGNIAIVLAALGVFGTGSGWPDFIVAAIMGTLGIAAAVSVIRQTRAELLSSRQPPLVKSPT
jgi:Co/Zn/Cd efflux system component